jgi:hypothetical protein
LKIQTKAPDASVVIIVVPPEAQFDPPVGVCQSESNSTVACPFGVNPDPVTV